MGKQIKRILRDSKKGILLISLAIAIFLFTMAFISAQIYAQNSDVNIKVSCLNIDCAITPQISIEYPNTTLAVDNETMTIKDGFVNYTFLNTNDFGTYRYFLASVGGTPAYYEDSFIISYDGKEITTGQGVLYVSLFLILIFFFAITLLGINQLPPSNQRDEEGKILSISYLKYLRPIGWMFMYMLIVAILYLSSNLAFVYLNEQLFAEILFVLFRLSFMFSPVVVIIWIIWIYRQMFHDRELQSLLNRGFFPQGKL